MTVNAEHECMLLFFLIYICENRATEKQERVFHAEHLQPSGQSEAGGRGNKGNNGGDVSVGGSRLSHGSANHAELDGRKRAEGHKKQLKYKFTAPQGAAWAVY